MKQFLALACAGVLLAIPAKAHPVLQDGLWVKFEPSRVRVAVDATVKEIALEQKVEDAGEIARETPALIEAAERHASYLLSHFTVFVSGAALTGRVTRVTPPREWGFSESTRFQYEIEYPSRATTPAPAQARFRQDILEDVCYSPGQNWQVSYQVRFMQASSEKLESALLSANETLALPTGLSKADPVETSPAHDSFWAYFRHGVMHILTGYDHLLFVTALVLGAAGLWEMVKVIAAFTLAHTLTLTLSVYGIFRLPPVIVEPTIAASIVFVAVENILWPARAKSWARLAVAFGFGLVHGLGFAGGMIETMRDLPAASLALALLAFSLGVEAGHQVVVLPLFGCLRLGSARWSSAFQKPVLLYGSLCISAAGVFYFVNALRET